MSLNSINLEEYEKVKHYCFECYGLGHDIWENYELFKKKEGLWLAPKGFKDNWLSVANSYGPEGVGLRILSGKSFPYKITASFVQAFGKHINKRLVELSEEQAIAVIHRQPIECLESRDLVYGYYIGVFKGRFIGILLLGKEGWTSQVPKSFSGQISKSLKLSNQ